MSWLDWRDNQKKDHCGLGWSTSHADVGFFLQELHCMSTILAWAGSGLSWLMRGRMPIAYIAMTTGSPWVVLSRESKGLH